jgi:protein-disulfide isomerase
VVLASDHVLGDATAPLVVVLYEDYQDTGCGRFARSEFPTIKARYIDTGQVLWVFRHFPLASHNRAIPAAKAAECADDQGEFLAYRDLIYETTDSSGNTILTDAQLGAHADTLGLNRATLEACFAGEAKTARVQQDVKSGTALGVTVAPSFIVGNKLVSGFTLAEDLSTTIDRQLAGP